MNQKFHLIQIGTNDLFESSAEDPHKLDNAVSSICETLYCIKSQVKQESYLKKVSSKFKIKQQILKETMKRIDQEETAKQKRLSKFTFCV